MMDLHPPISGLPLAGALLLVFAELSPLSKRLAKRSEYLREIAVIGSLLAVAAAFISGYQASSKIAELTPAVETALAWHHFNGRLLLINSLLLFTFFLLARVATHTRATFKVLYYLAALVQVALTIWVGSLGGGLVFNHAVNVQRVAPGTTGQAN
jgi:uncharacterized membrane protein